MYAVISLPLESRTRATLRSAEFGFLGVIVLTWRQTPRLNGQASSTGDLVLYLTGRRGLRTSWLIVGMSGVVPLTPAGPEGVCCARSGWRWRGIPASPRAKQVVYRTHRHCQADLRHWSLVTGNRPDLRALDPGQKRVSDGK